MIIKEIMPEQTYLLRHQILRPLQPIEKCHYPSDHIAETFHLGAYIDQKNVGIISVEPDINSNFDFKVQYRIRGMAVLPDFRNQHVGASLVMQAMKRLKDHEIEFVWFNAREIAFKFYEKMGFKYYGNAFEIENIGPHKVMFALVKEWKYERQK